MKTVISADPPVNQAPPDLDPARDLPRGFSEFLLPLHRAFSPRQQELAARRRNVLDAAHQGRLPDYRPASEATTGSWKVSLPGWCQDQRNQMTGPADDGELVVKMLNSGAPGVMLDLEDSVANAWPNITQGARNIIAALRGELTYQDKKRDREVGINESKTVILTRPRGLHLEQAGVFKGERMAAALFDVALVAYQVDPSRLKHPLSIYIAKSESADEALWWRDLFQAVSAARGWPSDYIKCMALVESHPLAYQMEEFAYNLREHMMGLNLGRWDYMASLIDFTLHDPAWVLPDRNTIPHDVAFFQNLREVMPEVCHKRGMLAIGGMTALYPSREDPELNARALKVLEQDKKNEANSLMDGAWTGHPDQNEIAVNQFPYPNQVQARRQDADIHKDLRPSPEGVGKRTLEGTRAAVRTVIRYRNGVLNGKGASLLDGYMEDLATDRIYRYMIAQRILHKVSVTDAGGRSVVHSPEMVSGLFDEELERLVAQWPKAEAGSKETMKQARDLSEGMVLGILEAQGLARGARSE
jgi:malate synthase